MQPVGSHRFPIIIVAVICIAPLAQLGATSAIALRSRHRIVLAADSRAVYRVNGSATECKLFEFDDVYATVSGLARYGTSFRATDAVRDGFAGPGSFQSHVQATAVSLRLRVEHLLMELRASSPNEYHSITRPAAGQSDLVQLAVAETVNGEPMLGIIELQRGVAGNGITVSTSICPGSCRGSTGIFYLGYWERIKPYVDGSGQPRSVGSAASLDRLIRLEMRAHPRDVGPPIDILELSRSGARWLQNGGNCSLPGVSW